MEYMRAKDCRRHLNFHYSVERAFLAPDNTRAVYWMKSELNKLHLQFYHPSSVNLYILLSSSSPEYTPSTVLDTLKQIAGACETWQERHTRAFRFSVSIPEDALRFIAEVAMYLVWLDGGRHVVDCQNRYQNAALVQDKSSVGLWTLFIMI